MERKIGMISSFRSRSLVGSCSVPGKRRAQVGAINLGNEQLWASFRRSENVNILWVVRKWKFVPDYGNEHCHGALSDDGDANLYLVLQIISSIDELSESGNECRINLKTQNNLIGRRRVHYPKFLRGHWGVWKFRKGTLGQDKSGSMNTGDLTFMFFVFEVSE